MTVATKNRCSAGLKDRKPGVDIAGQSRWDRSGTGVISGCDRDRDRDRVRTVGVYAIAVEAIRGAIDPVGERAEPDAHQPFGVGQMPLDPLGQPRLAVLVDQ